ncbi:SIMPL domain-containing protein [Candidatus Kaiserbacteria bacterium]|nr:SIMPL domain-containing protein [Candidatus Kaiserbacteria bacterium]
MDTEKKEIHIMPPELIVKAVALALGMLALFLLVVTVSELRSFKYIGAGISPTNTIVVSGQGEVFAVPDTGEFSVTIQEEAKDVATAQDAMAKKANAIIVYLKDAGVAEKDIKTTDYSVSPQYEWSQGICTNGYCPPGKQNLTGFQAAETLDVKVRDTKKAGDLLSGVGGKGAYQVSGLSFTVDDEDTLKAQARDKAIEQAKTKADALAKSLGVSIVRVVGFNENEGGVPVPMYARADMAAGVSMEKSVAPDIAVGQNKITSNVSVTYEIR